MSLIQHEVPCSFYVSYLESALQFVRGPAPVFSIRREEVTLDSKSGSSPFVQNVGVCLPVYTESDLYYWDVS